MTVTVRVLSLLLGFAFLVMAGPGIAAMPDDQARKFVGACVLPAVRKMQQALAGKDSPYEDVIVCLAMVLHHVWGEGETLIDGSEAEHPDINGIPGGVDPLHAFPVAGIGCGSGCSGSCGEPETVPLEVSVPMKGRQAGEQDE